MQWSAAPHGGFTTADEPVRPVIADGRYGYPTVNATAQQRDADSLLRWFEHMVHTLRECPEIGSGTCTPLDAGHPAVLAHRMDGATGSLLFLHNLGRDDVRVEVGEQPDQADGDLPLELLADRGYDAPSGDLTGLELGGYGYRWIRLRRKT
jgi:maltose alpha-D-glucosyltransferase/alpha-amylase